MRVPILLCALVLLTACQGDQADTSPPAVEGGAGAELQQPADAGASAEQVTEIRRFEPRLDGGRIEVQHATDDPEAIAGIRDHLQAMTAQFQEADFRMPGVEDVRSIPGAIIMGEKHDAITYTYEELPRGGEIYITTEDPYAIDAIHSFVEFHREAHAAGEHMHHP